MEKYFLYGSGGHAKVIFEILQSAGFSVAGVFDNLTKEKIFNDLPIIDLFDKNIMDEGQLIICVGDNAARKMLSKKTAVKFGIAIHPAAVVSPSSKIGRGTVLMAGAVVNAEAIIGEHVILNTNCSVDHHCIIDDYVHIAPNTALAGNVTVGEGTMLGVGVSVIPGVRIGKWCMIGAGAVVVNDIPDYAVALGVPAKVIKYNKE